MQIGETFKMRLNGQRVQAVILGPDDIIDEKTFFTISSSIFTSCSLTYEQRIEKIDRDYVGKFRWSRSECIGENIKEHDCRRYIRVTSPWFN